MAGQEKHNPVRVWDRPVRVLHWALAASVGTSFLSYQIGAMQLHGAAGILIISLVVTRLLWGVIGSDTAKFSHFVTRFPAVKDYAKALLGGQTPHSLGHNPLGGWAVVALLVSCLIQAVLGLFSRTDEDRFLGPLANIVSRTISESITGLHEGFSTVVMIVVGIHIAANIFYHKVRKENFVTPMVTGYKQAVDVPDPAAAARLRFVTGWLALVVWLLVAGGMYFGLQQVGQS